MAPAVTLAIPLEPVPASRPRVSKWGTYIAKPYKDWLDSAAEVLKHVKHRLRETPLIVSIDVVCTKARTSKLVIPRADTDNYVKAALDAITHAGIWPDDRWVECLAARKRFAKEGEQTGTFVNIWESQHIPNWFTYF